MVNLLEIVVSVSVGPVSPDVGVRAGELASSPLGLLVAGGGGPDGRGSGGHGLGLPEGGGLGREGQGSGRHGVAGEVGELLLPLALGLGPDQGAASAAAVGPAAT